VAMSIRDRLVYLRRRALARWLYRSSLSQLGPERLYLWAQTIIDTAKVPGAVVEIGCASGGTAAHCDRLLRNIGAHKSYVAVDTFDGFVPDQFDHDVERGTPESCRHGFAASSLPLVRQILRQLGAPDVELIRGDIVTLAPERLPQLISAVLVDVDLSLPVYAALQKTWPRMSPGGMILVDDCDAQNGFRARDGFRQFCGEQGLPERYEYGMGVLRPGILPMASAVPDQGAAAVASSTDSS
jgi:O-methyltransferase